MGGAFIFTFEDKDPSPPVHASDALHMANSVGQETATCTGNGGTNKEISNAQAEFFLGVERGQIDSQAREPVSNTMVTFLPQLSL